MIDLVKLILKAGDGGNGRVSFRREKYVPKGGPDGGDGGNGGNIIIRGSKHKATLQDFAGVNLVSAKPGQAGGKRKRSGEKAEDVVVEVPVGTTVWLVAENEAARTRRQVKNMQMFRRGDLPVATYHQELGEDERIEGQPMSDE